MNKLATTVRLIPIAFLFAFVIGTWMLLFGLFVQAVKPGTLIQYLETVFAMSAREESRHGDDLRHVSLIE